MSKNTKNFLSEVIKHIQSDSIKSWIMSDHNYPIISKMAANHTNTDPIRYASYLICLYIG